MSGKDSKITGNCASTPHPAGEHVSTACDKQTGSDVKAIQKPLFPFSAEQCRYIGATGIDFPGVKRTPFIKRHMLGSDDVTYTSACAQTREIDHKFREVITDQSYPAALIRARNSQPLSTWAWATQRLVVTCCDIPEMLSELYKETDSQLMELAIQYSGGTRVCTLTFQIRKEHLAIHVIEADFFARGSGVCLNILSREPAASL
jgi:hypothetical protein